MDVPFARCGHVVAEMSQHPSICDRVSANRSWPCGLSSHVENWFPNLWSMTAAYTLAVRKFLNLFLPFFLNENMAISPDF